MQVRYHPSLARFEVALLFPLPHDRAPTVAHLAAIVREFVGERVG